MRAAKWSVLAAAVAALAGQASASLIFSGVIPSTGNGIGAVNTSLTFQNTGTESGCVAFNGTTSFTGAGACPSGFTGGNESPGASQTNVFTAADVGISGARTFSNLVVLFNGNEGGNAGDQPITLSSLGLSLYATDGTRLATFTSTAPMTFLAFPGVGNAGFGFVLDSTQAAQANAFLAANPLLRIGTEATATNAQGGPETIQLTTVAGPSAVPEPGTVTMLTSGLLLIGLSALRRRSRS